MSIFGNVNARISSGGWFKAVLSLIVLGTCTGCATKPQLSAIAPPSAPTPFRGDLTLRVSQFGNPAGDGPMGTRSFFSGFFQQALMKALNDWGGFSSIVTGGAEGADLMLSGDIVHEDPSSGLTIDHNLQVEYRVEWTDGSGMLYHDIIASEGHVGMGEGGLIGENRMYRAMEKSVQGNLNLFLGNLGSAVTSVLRAQNRGGGGRLEGVRDSYLQGNLGDALLALNSIDPIQLTQSDHARWHLFRGLILFADGAEPEAAREFSLAKGLDTALTLDPLVYGPERSRAFQQVDPAADALSHSHGGKQPPCAVDHTGCEPW